MRSRALETMVTMANSNLGLKVIRHQVASAIHLILQVIRFSDGTRRVTHITECTGMEGDIITLQDVFLFDKTGVTADGKTVGRFRATRNSPQGSGQIEDCWNRIADVYTPERRHGELLNLRRDPQTDDLSELVRQRQPRNPRRSCRIC